MSKLIKRLTGDFTIINNKILRNTKLGVTDRGTLCTLLALPDNWDYSIRGLAAILPDGVTKIQNSLHRLEHKYHYLKRVRVFEGGHIVDWDYIISDEPMLPDEDETEDAVVENSENSSFFDRQETDLAHTDSLDTENPHQENQHLKMQHGNKELNNQEPKNKILMDQESINQTAAGEHEPAVETVENMIDGVIEGYCTDTKKIKNIIMAHIEYDQIVEWIKVFGGDMTIAEIKQLVNKLAKAATCGQGRTINSEGDNPEHFTKYEVQEAVLNINRECIDMAVDVLRKKAPGTVTHKTGYLVSVLIKIGSQYDIEANCDNRSITYDVNQMLGYGND